MAATCVWYNWAYVITNNDLIYKDRITLIKAPLGYKIYGITCVNCITNIHSECKVQKHKLYTSIITHVIIIYLWS